MSSDQPKTVFTYVPPPTPPCEVCGQPSQLVALTIVVDDHPSVARHFAVHGPQRCFCATHKPFFTLYPIGPEHYPSDQYRPPPPTPCEVCGERSDLLVITAVANGVSIHGQALAIHGTRRSFCTKHQPFFTLYPIKYLYPGYKTGEELLDDDYYGFYAPTHFVSQGIIGE